MKTISTKNEQLSEETKKEIESLLMSLLKEHGMSEEGAIIIFLALKEHWDLMADMSLWINENHPTKDDILKSVARVGRLIQQGKDPYAGLEKA